MCVKVEDFSGHIFAFLLGAGVVSNLWANVDFWGHFLLGEHQF